MPATGTFTNFVDRLSKHGVPAVIDRQFIGGSWGSQREMHAALKFLGLIDEEDKPTDDLQSLANTDEAGRREIYRVLVETCYAGALDLGPKATQSQLDGWFRQVGLSGDSARKAQSFFLSMARAGGIEVSPYFKATRSTSSTPRKRTAKKKTEPPAKPPTAESAPPKAPAGDQQNVHPSILAVLDKIPGEGEDWTMAELTLLVTTFEGLLKLFHPAMGQNAAYQAAGQEKAAGP